jgi:predicted MFS family arabinose efflux permease
MSGWRGHATVILTVLTVINFLNYIDQRLLSAVLEQIKLEFSLSDTQGGLLGSMFVVTYTIAAPLGYLGDRVRRKTIIAAGVALWSLATLAAGLARTYEELLVCRALLGVGEAAYATCAPSIIADLYSKDERSRKLAIFYLATPVGSALGFILGGLIGAEFGWRAVFLVGGLPGLLFAGLAALLHEPTRGARDPDEAPQAQTSLPSALARIFRTPAWRYNTVGLAMMTFTVGGLALWMPTYLQRVHGMTEGASEIFGAITVLAGILGTLIGGVLGDRMQARSAGGYFTLSGIGLVLSAPLIALVTLLDGLYALFVAVFFAEMLLFLNTGPLNAALVGCVPATLRSTAFALNIFFIHALGDALSNTLIGYVSDRATAAVLAGDPAPTLAAKRAAEAWGLNLAIATTALPVLLGGLVLLWGARRIARAPAGLTTYPG